MLWGIDTATWAELWSGVIGSFIAAVIGGLVALLVVRLTNSQGSRHAEKARQVEAIANLVASAEAANFTAARSEDPMVQFHEMRAALLKLRMSGTDSQPVAHAINPWPHKLTSLLLTVMGMGRNTEDFKQLWSVVNSAISTLSTLLPDWPEASPEEREFTLRRLSEESAKLTAEVAKHTKDAEK